MGLILLVQRKSSKTGMGISRGTLINKSICEQAGNLGINLEIRIPPNPHTMLGKCSLPVTSTYLPAPGPTLFVKDAVAKTPKNHVVFYKNSIQVLELTPSVENYYHNFVIA